MKLLWKMFPRAAFFEVYVPARERGERPQLPLVVESTEARLVEPYTKMFYRLFTAREVPLFRMLFVNANCDPAIAHRIAANLAITLASEDIVTYLIDLDLREPFLHDLFHVERSPGMVEYLLKGAEPDGVVRETGIPELKFVPSGSTITEPGDIVSSLGWRNTLERLIPPGVVSLIYAGRGDGFDLSELMKEVDGTILLISSGERIDRRVRRELKLIRKRSDVVGVIWTNPLEYPFHRSEQPEFGEDSPHEEDFGALSEPGEETLVEGDGEADYPMIDDRDIGFGDEGDRKTETGEGEREGTGMDDGTLVSREYLATFASRMSGLESRNEVKNREGEMEENVSDAKQSEPVDAGSEESDRKLEEKSGVAGEDSQGGWEEDEEREENLDLEGDEFDSGERDLFDGHRGRGRSHTIWIAFFGIVFVILIAWLLYESGLFSRDEQLREMLTEEVGSQEASPGTITGEEIDITEETPPKVGDEETAGARPGLLSDGGITPFSLILASFQQMESAEKGKDQLLRAGFDAYVVPVEIPGLGRWFRVMQGQYPDRDAALAMLEQVGKKSGFREGRVVQSSLAFLMGGFGSRELAEQAFEIIEAKGLDPYILESGKEEKIYFLYLGAFENEGQSRYLGEILAEKELSGSLVSRKGFHR